MYDESQPFHASGQLSRAALAAIAEQAAAATAFSVGAGSGITTPQGVVATPPVSGLELLEVVYESYDYLACIPYTTPLANTDGTATTSDAGQGLYSLAIPGKSDGNPGGGAGNFGFSREYFYTSGLISQIVYVAKPYALQISPWINAVFAIEGQTGTNAQGVSLPNFDNLNGPIPDRPVSPLNPIGQRPIVQLKNGYEVYLTGAVPQAGGALGPDTAYVYVVTLVVNGQEQACSAPLTATTTDANDPAGAKLSVQINATAQAKVDGTLSGQKINVYRLAAGFQGTYGFIGTIAAPSGTFTDDGSIKDGKAPSLQAFNAVVAQQGYFIPATLKRQQIWPAYRPGDLLWVSQLDEPFQAGNIGSDESGGYRYDLTADPPALEGYLPTITHQDLNADGRTWQDLPTQYGDQILNYFSTSTPTMCVRKDNLYPAGRTNAVPSQLYAAVTVATSTSANTVLVVLTSPQDPFAPDRKWSGALPWYSASGALQGIAGVTMVGQCDGYYICFDAGGFGQSSICKITSQPGAPIIVTGSGVSVFAQLSDLAAAFPALVGPPGPATKTVTFTAKNGDGIELDFSQGYFTGWKKNNVQQ